MSDVQVDPAQITEDAVEVGAQIEANPKGFWRSRTFWFNIITAGLHYTGLLPAHATPSVLIAGNVALRLISNGSVSLTGK